MDLVVQYLLWALVGQAGLVLLQDQHHQLVLLVLMVLLIPWVLLVQFHLGVHVHQLDHVDQVDLMDLVHLDLLSLHEALLDLVVHQVLNFLVVHQVLLGQMLLWLLCSQMIHLDLWAPQVPVAPVDHDYQKVPRDQLILLVQ